MSEVVVRPDFESVVSDEKNREIIEEFENEAKTRTLTGLWARFATSLSVATTLFALYYAAAGAEIPFTSIVLVPTISVFGETITTKQIYEMLFLAAVLTLTFILYPAHRRFLARVNPILDLLPAIASVAIALYVLLNFEQVIYRANSPTPTDFVFGTIAIVVVLEAARRTIGWHLPLLGVIAMAYAMLKKAGHDRESSGAILSAGGIGAVISPPVLGPAAFIMAELLRISYLDVVIMAMMPTILFYLGILLTIEIDARRLKAQPIVLDAPSFWWLTKRYWYQYTSLFAIIAFLLLGFSTITAIFWSILLAIVVPYLRKETALTPKKLIAALSSGTRQVL